MLHIVSSREGIDSCVRMLRPCDAVCFLGDACYSVRPTDCSATYVIQEDLEARGIFKPKDIKGIGYDDLVELVVAFPRSASW